jgi:mono/diheme cytochrome c family protein
MTRAVLLSLTLAAVALHGQTPDGGAVYAKHCARCHEIDKTGWAPKREVLARMPPQVILGTLHVGFMSMVATLSDAEKAAVTSWLLSRSTRLKRTRPASRGGGSAHLRIPADLGCTWRAGRANALARTRIHSIPNP